MKIPLGISDFKEIIEDRYYYIDKTLLIDELKHANGKVLVIPRPRRFGKTLNLSMLKYFFEKTENSNAFLFEHTNIWKQPEYRKFQGAYQVIFLTFKNCKETNWDNAYKSLIMLIADELKRHLKMLTPHLQLLDLETFMPIAQLEASYTQYAGSIFYLSMLLEKHLEKRVIVLIDDYDTPLIAAYSHGYYKEMIAFMQDLLTNVFKDNKHLERGILTGVQRTPTASIFSGLNNIKVQTLLNDKFSDKFGFTPDEVDKLLIDAKLVKKSALIKDWYNGYRCGSTTIYNPWSLLECINNNGILDPYWANTSDNEIIKKLIAQADENVKSELELLLEGTSIKKEIESGLIFPGIENNQKALWSLLLFAGYVTFTKIRRTSDKTWYTLTLPNQEIKLLYRSLITSIFEQSLTGSKTNYLKVALTEANGELFGELLQEFTLKSMSSFDIPESEPERSYHLFVLGLLVAVGDAFQIKSNRESGYGRYDILLIPHDKKRWGIIIEFKKVISTSEETLALTAQKALDQIKGKRYAQELQDLGVSKIAAFGIACKGKKIFLNTEILS